MYYACFVLFSAVFVTAVLRALSRCRTTHTYTALPDIDHCSNNHGKDGIDDDNDNCGCAYSDNNDKQQIIEPSCDAASIRYVHIDTVKSNIHALGNGTPHTTADTMSEVSSMVTFLDVKQYLYGSPSPIDDSSSDNSFSSCKSV